MSESLFTTKTVKIDTLGEYLASVRQQYNLDIKNLSLLTQIKQEYLVNLEAGNYAALPSDVYVRGFLKNLAEFYHMKEKILVDQYEKERGFEARTAQARRFTGKRWSLTPKTLIIVGSSLAAVLALSYVIFQIQSVLSPPVLEVSEPASDMAINSDSIVVAGKAEIGADVFLNNQQIVTDATGEFNENLILSPGLNVVKVSEKNKFGKESTITRQITAQPPQAPVAPTAAVDLTVNIGPGSAWVDLEADGVVVERGTMLAGSSKTVAAKSQVILTSANAGSTDVVYNGKDLGKLGREDEVIRNVEFGSQ